MKTVKVSESEPVTLTSEDSKSNFVVFQNNEGKLVIERPKNLGRRKSLTTLEYLESMDGENPCKLPLLQLYWQWKRRFEEMPAGAKNHHSQVGGLNIHTAQVIEIALDMAEIKKSHIASEVTRDDIIIAAFLHDFSKVVMYRRLPPDEVEKNNGREFKFDSNLGILDAETWTLQKCLVNALHYAEGGFATWVNQRNQPKWSKLGVLISCADVYSAMILGK